MPQTKMVPGHWIFRTQLFNWTFFWVWTVELGTCFFQLFLWGFNVSWNNFLGRPAVFSAESWTPGWTCFRHAVEKGHEAVALLLLRGGARVQQDGAEANLVEPIVTSWFFFCDHSESFLNDHCFRVICLERHFSKPVFPHSKMINMFFPYRWCHRKFTEAGLARISARSEAWRTCWKSYWNGLDPWRWTRKTVKVTRFRWFSCCCCCCHFFLIFFTLKKHMAALFLWPFWLQDFFWVVFGAGSFMLLQPHIKIVSPKIRSLRYLFSMVLCCFVLFFVVFVWFFYFFLIMACFFHIFATHLYSVLENPRLDPLAPRRRARPCEALRLTAAGQRAGGRRGWPRWWTFLGSGRKHQKLICQWFFGRKTTELTIFSTHVFGKVCVSPHLFSSCFKRSTKITPRQDLPAPRGLQRPRHGGGGLAGCRGRGGPGRWEGRLGVVLERFPFFRVFIFLKWLFSILRASLILFYVPTLFFSAFSCFFIRKQMFILSCLFLLLTEFLIVYSFLTIYIYIFVFFL